MGVVLAALWWIATTFVSLVLVLLGSAFFVIFIFAVPTSFFFFKALKSDWKEVQTVLSDTEIGLKEDAESLIAGPSSSEIQTGETTDTAQALSGKKDEKLAAKRSEDTEAGSALLKAEPSDLSEQDDFASPKPEAPPAMSTTSLYGRKIAVVIPVLNEEASLPATLDRLNQLHPPVSVIIVADGGSTDRTVSIAEAKGAVVVQCPEKGRAKQMNAGAKEAANRMREQDDQEGADAMMGSVSGDSIICFLHADTSVPLDLVNVLQSKFAEPATCCAGFVPLISIPGRVFWFVSFIDVGKTWFCAFFQNPRAFFKGMRILYGDQALSCCTRDFFRVGGYDEAVPIFEDADLCERLHNEMGPGGQPGKVCLIPRLVVTSGRRFAKAALKMFMLDLYFAWHYFRRVSSEDLHELYNRLYKDVR